MNDVPRWEYEGEVEFDFSGYEGYTTVYLDSAIDEEPDLADVLAKHFAKEFREDKDYWKAVGKLRISVELVAPFVAPKPRQRERIVYEGLLPSPKCNCVHIYAPDEHLPYCATWGGKRLPGSEKS